jgi:glucose-6-phosphate 1-dehydrogenase
MVIFGGGGDLTKRKLIPSLHNLSRAGLLPKEFAVIGVGNRDFSSEVYRESLGSEIREMVGSEFSPEIWADLEPRLHYLEGDFRSPDLYSDLHTLLATIDRSTGTGGNYLFYLATPPVFFHVIPACLGREGLLAEEDDAWRRVIVEKPFGRDLDSAKALNRDLLKCLAEEQIYRIDHYLGKETVQNILVYRFANGTTEPVWNRRYIDHVQITVAETLGVEGRAGYYEKSGALRDMVPNHLLVLLGITAMEPPGSFEAETLRQEATKVLRSIQPFSLENLETQAVRGQYDEGTMQGGQKVRAYRNEPGVRPTSGTDTYVAMKLMIDNWRWAGVPFYLRTGKRLRRRCTEIAIQYKHAPVRMFCDTPVDEVRPNVLVLKIQPEEEIEFTFGAKVPGPSMHIGDVEMDFRYADYFGDTPRTGYETLIYDCMTGDPTLFRRSEGVQMGWELVQPLLDAWGDREPKEFPNYASGTSGPAAADELLGRGGRKWRPI